MQRSANRSGKYSSLAGCELREVRERYRLSQGEVAARARMALATISNIERGLVTVTYDAGSRLLESLHSLGADITPLRHERVESYWSHQENKLK